MITRPFNGYVPPADKVSEVISPPYDVVSREEAAKMGEDRPNCMIHINRPEIAFPGVDATDDRVYQKGADLIEEWIHKNLLVKSEKPAYYVLRSTLGDHVQVGLYSLVSCEQYAQGLIKKHEQTRAAPELDRTKTVRIQNANVGSVFLAFRGDQHAELRDYIKSMVATEADRIGHLGFDNTKHELWIIDQEEKVNRITELFSQVPHLYIADGHHRAASAYNVWKERKEADGANYKGNEPYCFFMACVFADSELCVIDYNRVVYGLDKSTPEFLELLKGKGFEVTEIQPGECPQGPSFLPPHHARPTEHKSISMYLRGKWYRMKFVAEPLSPSPEDQLDSKILTDFVLTPLFGITDLRSAKNVKFIGGTRGLTALEAAASTEDSLAFAVPPVTMAQLFDVADAGKMMPPKSTWFVPKLADGMVIRKIE